MSKNVVLIYTKTGYDVLGINVGFPLSIMYVGTALDAAGYNVKILDERAESDFPGELKRALQERPLYVGISSMTGKQIDGSLRAAEMVRSVDPTIPIVWGGVHPSLCQESTLKHPLVDVIAIGDGEETAVSLARAYAAHSSIEGIPSIGYKKNGRMHINPEGPMLDLDSLPRLKYDLVDVSRYFTIGHTLRENQLQIATSRGCPFRCTFCYILRFNPHSFRWMSAKRVVSELKDLSRRYGVRSIFFYDDYFFANKPRVVEMMDLLEQENLHLKFEVSCRIDFLYKQSQEFINRMHRVGFRELLMGIESGSPGVLKMIKKDFTVEQVIEANRKLAKAGIATKCAFMAGFPGETRADALQTVELMLRLRKENPYASITPLSIYTPYPGTEIYEQCVKEFGMTFPDNLEDWARYDWQINNNVFLDPEQYKLITRLNLMSRFFDEKAFERFGSRRFKWLVMSFYRLYNRLVKLRLRYNFFGFMPEVQALNFLQNLYIRMAHQQQLARSSKQC